MYKRQGHSGAEIHLHRANANVLVARLLAAVAEHSEMCLVSWNGGSKHNAITREASAVFAVKRSNLIKVRDVLETERKAILKYYSQRVENRPLEPDIRITVTETEAAPCLAPTVTEEIVATLSAIPHGPRTFSPQIPSLVETSCNLAVVRTASDELHVAISARSSVDAELEAFRRAHANIGRLGGWEVKVGKAYPGWTPDPDSPLLQYVRTKYEEALGHEVRVEAVHAGLECGIIGARIPGIQMVSVGPTIRNPHTPDERVRIKDVEVFYSFIKTLLRDITQMPT